MLAIIMIFLVVAYLMVGIGLWAQRSLPIYTILTWPLSIMLELAKSKSK